MKMFNFSFSVTAEEISAFFIRRIPSQIKLAKNFEFGFHQEKKKL